jgi:hypothetical protein
MSLIASNPHAKALGDGPKKRPASHWTLPGNHPEAEAENEPSVPSVTIVFDQLLILHELLIMLATDALNSLMRMWRARLFSSRSPERLVDAHRSKVISLAEERLVCLPTTQVPRLVCGSTCMSICPSVIGNGAFNQFVTNGMGFTLVSCSAQVSKPLGQGGTLVLSVCFANRKNEVVKRLLICRISF